MSSPPRRAIPAPGAALEAVSGAGPGLGRSGRLTLFRCKNASSIKARNMPLRYALPSPAEPTAEIATGLLPKPATVAIPSLRRIAVAGASKSELVSCGRGRFPRTLRDIAGVAVRRITIWGNATSEKIPSAKGRPSVANSGGGKREGLLDGGTLQ